MHDPMTVAWEINLPLPWKEPKTYKAKDGTRKPRALLGGRKWQKLRLVTIWHVDPETDGTDDSCSISKRLTKLQRSTLDHAGSDEARDPWFRRERAKQPASPADAECLLRGGLWHTAIMLGLNRWSLFHKRITFAHCERLACELLHNTIDNVRGSLCLLPGWHTNDRMVRELTIDGKDSEDLDPNSPEWERLMEAKFRQPADDYPAEASDYWRKELSEGFFRMCGRILSRESARWWQHKRWHFWHWKFQVHPWQRFYRRFLARCSTCGVRFRGRTAYSDWHGTRIWCAACEDTTARTTTDVTPDRANA